ncbi:MAG: FKBP-type peptidyl-prolyl cis-trans isomerase, partial [Candidatus Micrarchaeota archaeon]
RASPTPKEWPVYNPGGYLLQEKTVQAGDVVFVDYTGYFENGTVFDSNRPMDAAMGGINKVLFEPLIFKVGEGNVLPGFEEAIIGMKINDSKIFTIPPEKGYGKYNPVLEVTESLSKLESLGFNVTLDEVISIDNQHYWIESITGDEVKLDGNNIYFDGNAYKRYPLFDKTLIFNVTVILITDDELNPYT